jgi:hypothetical protein
MTIDEHGVLHQLWTPPSDRRSTTRTRIVLPSTLRRQVLEECHDCALGGGHAGFLRTYDKVRERFYWEGMYAEVKH